MVFNGKDKISTWAQTIKDDIRIKLMITADQRSNLLREFCDNLNRVTPKVIINKEKEEESPLPEIRIDNIVYQAVPEGRELDPFLNFLADRDSLADQLSSDLRRQLDKMSMPALLKIYITPHCPFCPQAVVQLLSLASASQFVRLTVIDGTLFTEATQSDDIQSAPTVLLDSQYRWTGAIQISEILDMILNRDPARLSVSSLQAMLEDGKAFKLAEMMINNGKIFPAFLELLVHNKWPFRLGAMVVYETIALKDKELAIQMVTYLWQYFPKAEDTVKGDILFMLGQSGDESLVSKLETVLTGTYSTDVKEAASEALEELRSR